MPDIENPQTFAEWYWRNSVDAVRARALEYEKALSPFIGDMLSAISSVEGMPSYAKRYLETLASPPAPSFDSAIVRFTADLGQGILQRVLDHEVKEFDYHMAHYLRNVRITDTVANALYLRKQITEDFWKERNLDAGYSEAEMVFNYESQKPYPNIADIISFARYNGPPDNPKDVAWGFYDIAPEIWPVWEWLSRQKLTTEQVLSLYRQGYMTDPEATLEITRLGWMQEDREKLYNLAWETPNAMLCVQGMLMRDISEENILNVVSKAGIHPAFAETYLNGVLTKPSPTDIIAYLLRSDPTLSTLPIELKRVGIHPNYHGMYRELAYQIPPVADIITMAVREAFTPDIAQRFGQYEGLPQEYVTWAQRKGLTREWAERYWAAHWSLPSPQQGFEMMHRGIISRDDLFLLLRALDIMPFWRDKLMAMSFTPFTRVDVRRMYNLGVISEAEVNRAYQDIGYDPLNAQRLTVFTVRLKQAQDKREAEAAAKAAGTGTQLWTTAQTLSFLKAGLITDDRARQEFYALGYNVEHTEIYIKSVAKKTG